MEWLSGPLSLEEILNHTCSNPVGDGYNEYRIDICCATFVIIAKCVSFERKSWDILKYQIV